MKLRALLTLGVLIFTLGCGESDSKPFEFDEDGNNTSGNNSTTVGNNTSGNNATTGGNNTSNTSGNNSTSGCSIPEPPVHREVAEACDSMRPAGSADDNGTQGAECSFDTDCIDNMGSENGRCVYSRGGPVCTYDTCFADGDCGSGVCHCEGGWGSDNNVCKTAGNCQIDSDCGEGSYCAPSLGECGDYGGVVGWFCRTCDDECVSDSDCPDNVDGGGPGYCMYDGQKWSCSNSFCVG